MDREGNMIRMMWGRSLQWRFTPTYGDVKEGKLMIKHIKGHPIFRHTNIYTGLVVYLERDGEIVSRFGVSPALIILSS